MSPMLLLNISRVIDFSFVTEHQICQFLNDNFTFYLYVFEFLNFIEFRL